MCLILLAWRSSAEFPCVLAANRDEFHRRPAAAAGWWPGGKILAGRDLQAGGTWLGLTRSGRFAALTNYRDASRPRRASRSRGGLVTHLLESANSVPEDLEWLREVSPGYDAFNVIFSDGATLGVFESMVGVGRELGAGVYGLSNHLLDTPWPKVRQAKSRLTSALADLENADALMHLLRDDQPASDAELPQTGISREWERLLSSAFIRAPDYGTRCSTVVRVDRGGGAAFDEWTWNPRGEAAGRAAFRFDITRA